jgi:hypothetical protein
VRIKYLFWPVNCKEQCKLEHTHIRGKTGFPLVVEDDPSLGSVVDLLRVPQLNTERNTTGQHLVSNVYAYFNCIYILAMYKLKR